MPQPIELKGWSPSPGAVLQRPEHAMRIAAIAAEWTQVERSMVRLLAGVYGRTLFTDEGPRDVEHHPVAVAAMESAETIRSRIKLLDASIGKMLLGTSVEDEWTALRDRLNSRARERNKVVHGSWGIEVNEPDNLVMQTAKGYVRWTVADLDDVLARLVEVRWQVIDLTTSIMNAVHRGEIAQGRMGPQSGWVHDRADGSAGG